MAEFRRSCRSCFNERGETVLLERRGDKWVCPKNSNHKYVEDIKVA